MFHWLINNPEGTGAISAIFSVIVSAFALFVAIVSVIYARKGLESQLRHNQLSVLPVPFVALADYEDLIRVKIRNDGSGPLLIRVINYQRGNAFNEYTELIGYLPQLPSDLAWSNFSSGYIRSIRAGEELILIELRIDEKSPRQAAIRDEIREVLALIEVHVEYTDVYETNFSSISRKLDFFARRLASSKVAKKNL